MLTFWFVLLQACTQQYRTVLTYPPEKVTLGNGQVRDPDNLYTCKIGGEYVNSMNILGLVFFSGKWNLDKTLVKNSFESSDLA